MFYYCKKIASTFFLDALKTCFCLEYSRQSVANVEKLSIVYAPYNIISCWQPFYVGSPQNKQQECSMTSWNLLCMFY